MDDIQKVSKFLIETFEKEDVSLFVGAGISLENPANLPSAMELKWEILKFLTGKEPHQDDLTLLEEYLSAQMLELMIQELKEALGETTSDILGVFNFGEPNQYHLLIAKLAKIGLLRRVFTTNFDCLIERALAIEGISYHTIATEHDFAEYLIYPEQFPDFAVLKLHGTIVFTEDGKEILKPKEVEAMSPLKLELRKLTKHLEQSHVEVEKFGFNRNVSSKQTLIASIDHMGLHLSESVREVLDKALRNSTFIILGWNGFDVDISPVFSENAKKTIWIVHRNKVKHEDEMTSGNEDNFEIIRKKLRKKGWDDYFIELSLLANTDYPLDVLPTPFNERAEIVTKNDSRLFHLYTPNLIEKIWDSLAKRIGVRPNLSNTTLYVNSQKENHLLNWSQTFHPLVIQWGLAKTFLYHGEYGNTHRLLSEDLIPQVNSLKLSDIEALMYLDLGELNATYGNREVANKYFLKSIDIYNNKIRTSSKTSVSGVAPHLVHQIAEKAYFHMGVLSCEFYEFKEAEAAFQKMPSDESVVRALVHYCREEFRESHELLCQTQFYRKGVSKFHYYLYYYLKLIDADMLWLFKKYEGAAQVYKEILSVSTKIGWPRHQVHSLNGLSKTYSVATDGYFKGLKRIDQNGNIYRFFDLPQAAKYALQAVKLANQAEYRVGRAFAGFYFARICVVAGLRDEANGALNFSEGYFKKLQHKKGLQFCDHLRSQYSL